jgi:pimeloyl-ACP methyl ester carboxylesterase
MNKLFKYIGYTLLTVLIGLSALVIAIAQKDIPREQLKAKYAKSPSQFMPLMGMQVHYRDEGNKEDTTPLVLIHGTSSSLNTWDSLNTYLPKHKRIIRLDMPAFGLTGPSPENKYSYLYYSQFLNAFLDQLHIKQCIIAGNSLGGGIAWHFALDFPQKVSKLILIDASGYPKINEKGSLGFKIASIPVLNNLLLYVTPKSLVKKSLETVFVDQSLITEERITRYHELLLAEGNRKAALSIFKNRFQQETERIKLIKQSTLIIFGEKDELINSDNAYLFQKDIKGSIAVVIKNVGHVPMEEAPKATADLINEFIK